MTGQIWVKFEIQSLKFKTDIQVQNFKEIVKTNISIKIQNQNSKSKFKIKIQNSKSKLKLKT